MSHVHVDRERLTGLVLLGIKDRDTFPLVFYRENCADMAISPADFDEAFIASAKALAITGTHLSRADTAATCRQALAYARKNDVRTVLDIDYRPVLWGLAGKADGENRYVADQGVSQHLQAIVGEFDLIVGTEEEFRIAGGSDDLTSALRAVRARSAALLVVKRGAQGCAVLEGEIPAALDTAPHFAGFPVEVMNVLERATRSRPGFFMAGCAANRSTPARVTPTPAAPWSSRATPARRPCRRGPSWIISSPMPIGSRRAPEKIGC